mmetsp:Transcript_62040/g.146283  ORF Transcript_62040/g.146283 Transcript_62040/m.146283 type:complete len:255 (+) Transcript_62040:1160-1924(+)
MEVKPQLRPRLNMIIPSCAWMTPATRISMFPAPATGTAGSSLMEGWSSPPDSACLNEPWLGRPMRSTESLSSDSIASTLLENLALLLNLTLLMEFSLVSSFDGRVFMIEVDVVDALSTFCGFSTKVAPFLRTGLDPPSRCTSLDPRLAPRPTPAAPSPASPLSSLLLSAVLSMEALHVASPDFSCWSSPEKALSISLRASSSAADFSALDCLFWMLSISIDAAPLFPNRNESMDGLALEAWRKEAEMPSERARA